MDASVIKGKGIIDASVTVLFIHNMMNLEYVTKSIVESHSYILKYQHFRFQPQYLTTPEQCPTSL